MERNSLAWLGGFKIVNKSGLTNNEVKKTNKLEY